MTEPTDKLPSGWRHETQAEAACHADTWRDYWHESDAMVRVCDSGEILYFVADANEPKGDAPTMLQAMCAALGIEIDADEGCFSAESNGSWLASGQTQDEVARAALEAFHARNAPKTSEERRAAARAAFADQEVVDVGGGYVMSLPKDRARPSPTSTSEGVERNKQGLAQNEQDALDGAMTWLKFRTRPSMRTKEAACQWIVMLAESLSVARSQLSATEARLAAAERERDAISESLDDLERRFATIATARDALKKLLGDVVSSSSAANHGMQCTCVICRRFETAIEDARKRLEEKPDAE